MSTLVQPKGVSRGEWLAARKALLAKEKVMIRELDALRAERRRLPWVKVETPYVFEGPHGKCTLEDLFEGRGQLAVYHFMLTPGSDQICKGCSFIADHIDVARQPFAEVDLAFVAISRAPLARIEEVRRRLGWTFPWVSSRGSSFNFDQAQRGYARHQHLCEARDRRHLPHLLDLPSWQRALDGRLHVA